MITTHEHAPDATIIACKDWIEAALEKSAFDGVITHSFEDVYQMLLAGGADLWATNKGCIVTFITIYPKAKILTLWLAGGDFDDVMLHLREKIEHHAAKSGCQAMHLSGRKGWERKLINYGFTPHQSIVMKAIKGTQL